MVIVLRLTASKNSIGHPAIEQDGSYRVMFRKTAWIVDFAVLQ
jgi:hypothetical protein